MAKFRIDRFRLRGTGSMCHMFLLNVEFSNACRFRVFQCHFFDRLAFSIPAFSVTPVLIQTNRVLEVARIFTKHSKCCDKFFVLTISSYAFRAYFATVLYKQLLQYTLLTSFTLSFALLTKFPKKFYMKLLGWDIIFKKNCPQTQFCFDAVVFHLSIKGYCKTRPHRSYCFLSMFKLGCKRH